MPGPSCRQVCFHRLRAVTLHRVGGRECMDGFDQCRVGGVRVLLGCLHVDVAHPLLDAALLSRVRSAAEVLGSVRVGSSDAEQSSYLALVLREDGGHAVDYRHVIWSLVRKPAAFAHYRYRSDLIPHPGLSQGLRRVVCVPCRATGCSVGVLQEPHAIGESRVAARRGKPRLGAGTYR